MAVIKKAVVFYLYGNRNAGDMAICVGAIELLKSYGYQITMVSRFSEAEKDYLESYNYLKDYYPDVNILPGPFSFDRDFSFFKKIISYFKSFAKVIGLIKDTRTKDIVHDADIVFFNGGNLLRGANITDYLRLIALFYPIRVAAMQGKNVFCLPQSTAKISKIGKLILGKGLSYFGKIYIRENFSFASVKNIYPKLEFEKSTDLAFFCKDTDIASERIKSINCDTNTKKIALILRNTGIGDIGTLDNRISNEMLAKISNFIKANRNYEYYIVVQTKKDLNVSNEFYKKNAEYGTLKIIENHDPLVLRELYKQMDYVITMRLHAGILSLSALTPVIGVFSEKWGLKNPGIMQDYGMPFMVIENDQCEIDELITSMPNNAKESIQNRIFEHRKSISLK